MCLVWSGQVSWQLVKMNVPTQTFPASWSIPNSWPFWSVREKSGSAPSTWGGASSGGGEVGWGPEHWGRALLGGWNRRVTLPDDKERDGRADQERDHDEQGAAGRLVLGHGCPWDGPRGAGRPRPSPPEPGEEVRLRL